MWATWMNFKDVMLRKHANHIKKTTAWLPLHEAPGESNSQRKCTIVATRDSGRGEGSHSLKKKAVPVGNTKRAVEMEGDDHSCTAL
jgi:hypothetical protein